MIKIPRGRPGKVDRIGTAHHGSGSEERLGSSPETSLITAVSVQEVNLALEEVRLNPEAPAG